MNSEQTLKSLIGVSAKEMTMTMINVNTRHGSSKTSTPKCIDYIKNCMTVVPKISTLIIDQSSTKNKLSVLDRFLVPFWFSVNSVYKRDAALKPFGGATESEELYNSIGIMASHQVMARWTNPDICAIFGSKLMYDSVGGKPDNMVDAGCYDLAESEYGVERGAYTGVGSDTNEMCRYILAYNRGDGKKNITTICGSADFIGGSQDIFKTVFMASDVITKNRKNDQRKGVDLYDIRVGSDIKKGQKKDDNESNDFKVKEASIQIARVLGGACFTHDYLKLVADQYEVESIIEVNSSGKSDKMTVVDIHDVIEDYAKVRKYTAAAMALNALA